MELDLRSRVAEKTEEQSGSVLLTYFQGDINSMVDEHFTRALSKATKPKGERPKNKRNGKSAQLNDSRQWETLSQKGFQPIFSSDRLQGGTHSNLPPNPHVSLNHPPNSALIWSGGCGPDVSRGLLPVVYPSAVSTEGLMVPEQQYTNSLVNLLHNDRPELSSVVVSSSKHDLISGWTKYPGFGNQMSSDVSLDSGVQVIEKKNLYWY